MNPNKGPSKDILAMLLRGKQVHENRPNRQRDRSSVKRLEIRRSSEGT